MSFFKDVEFKLMFKVLFGILVAFFCLFLISTAYEEFVEKPSKKKHPWKNFIYNNDYISMRDYLLNEYPKYQFSTDLIDFFYCTTLQVEDMYDVYNFKLKTLFEKYSKVKKLNDEDSMEAMAQLGAYNVIFHNHINQIEDENHKLGIKKYCAEILI